MFGQENFGLSGNVGIGTTSPSAKLDIETDYSYSGPVVKFRSGGSSHTLGYLSINKTYVGYSDLVHKFNWHLTLRQDGFNGQLPLDLMTFTHNGRIGINTDDPQTHLDVAGAMTVSGGTDGSGLITRFVANSSDNTAEGMYSLDIKKIFHGVDNYGPQYSYQFYMNQFGHGTNNYNVMTFSNLGRVGIGTDNPDHLLTVNGTIAGETLKAVNVALGDAETKGQLTVNGEVITDSIVVNTDHYADFVFEDDYDLPTLDEVEAFIDENGHLPNIPSEAEAMENGINLADMNVRLLQTVEELTLHMIEMKKEIEALKANQNQ